RRLGHRPPRRRRPPQPRRASEHHLWATCGAGLTPDPRSGAAMLGQGEPGSLRDRSPAWAIAVALAALAGLTLLADGVGRSSATYDEVAYLRVAARWWRTGDQEAITRMGSPLTFWKLQQAPVLWLLDRFGRRDL